MSGSKKFTSTSHVSYKVSILSVKYAAHTNRKTWVEVKSLLPLSTFGLKAIGLRVDIRGQGWKKSE